MTMKSRAAWTPTMSYVGTPSERRSRRAVQRFAIRLRHLLDVESLFLAHSLIVLGQLFDLISKLGMGWRRFGVADVDRCQPLADVSEEHRVCRQLMTRGTFPHGGEESQPELGRLTEHVDEDELVCGGIAYVCQRKNAIALEDPTCLR